MKIALRMQENIIFGYMYKEFAKCAPLLPVIKTFLHIQQNSNFGYMYEKSEKKWSSNKKNTKSALVPLVMKSLRMKPNSIFRYMCKKGSKSAPRPPVMKIALRMQ